MKIFLDADPHLLISLSILCEEGVCLLKRSNNLKKTGILNPRLSRTEQIFVNIYNDCADLSEFLGNFHMIDRKPKHLFVDLNVAKKKEVFPIISLLASLSQVAEVKIFCIFNSHGTHFDIWNAYGRVFDCIFVVSKRLVNLIQCEGGQISVSLLGDVYENLNKFIL